MPTVRANGINIYYEIHGEGQPLVIIGGLGSDISLYKSVVDALAATHKVIIFDNRGSGRTDKPDALYSMEMMADDTAALLQAISVNQANVMGISMGGRIALVLALKYPELVQSLTLVSTSARGYGKLTMSLPFRVLGLLSWLPVLRSAHSQPKYAHLRQRAATVGFSCVERLGEIAFPTLVLHGKKDKSVPFELAEETARGIHHARLMAFKGGHIFFLFPERAAFIQAVSRFLASIRS
jgi:3-oxoadipate enol-lactonase